MFKLFKNQRTAKGLTSVVFGDSGISVAHAKDNNGQPELTFCEHVACKNPFAETRRFKELIAKAELVGSKTVFVLPESSYQIVLVEKPELSDDELSEGLRWRLKDHINFELDEAAIDYIELPQDAYRGRNRMIYAVAALKAKVEQLAGWCHEIGLNPQIADVPELALLNLTEELADSEAGLAVFHVGEQSSAVNMLSDQALYFTRQLSYNSAARPEMAANAVLELQRSLDYFESQVGKPPCVRLMVMPLQDDDAPIMNELRYNLALDIYSLNLQSLIQTAIELPPALQKSSTIAIAALFRSSEQLKVQGAAQ